MQRWTWLICAGVVLGSVPTAWAETASPYPACTKTPTKADQEAAEGAFKAGFGSYQEGDYNKAIMYWEDAYQRDCTAHALLLNLANAHEKKAQWDRAIVALKVYLERAGDVPNRGQIERRIENLEAQIAAEKPAQPDKPPVTEPEPAQPSTAASVGTEKPAEGGKSIAPWIVVGAGGVMTIVGTVLYLGGSSKVSDAEEVCGSKRECPNTPAGQQAKTDGDDGRTQMLAGGIVAGVGVVGVAGGLAWHFFLDKPAAESQAAVPRTTVQPALGPSYAGLSFGGSF
jgi:hypothetical protein